MAIGSGCRWLTLWSYIINMTLLKLTWLPWPFLSNCTFPTVPIVPAAVVLKDTLLRWMSNTPSSVVHTVPAKNFHNSQISQCQPMLQCTQPKKTHKKNSSLMVLQYVKAIQSFLVWCPHVKWIIMVLWRAVKSQKTLMSGESEIYSMPYSADICFMISRDKAILCSHRDVIAVTKQLWA